MLEQGATAREKVNNEIIPAVLAVYGASVEQIPATNDQIPQLYVKPEAVLDIALWLYKQGFNMLVDIGGVDYHPYREPRFEVVYHFRQMPGLGIIRLRARCTEKDQPPTLSGQWPMANAAEREVYDQFGIKFKGHPNMKRILNPDDWEGYPLRRDYPVRGPRALMNLEMPADESRYHPFMDEDAGEAIGDSTTEEAGKRK